MPRKIIPSEPEVINVVNLPKTNGKSLVLEIATSNKNKLKEFERLLPKYVVAGKSLSIEEIQSTDTLKVASHKAMDAYRANGYNPILVEDTSLEIKTLDSFPGTYAKVFLI